VERTPVGEVSVVERMREAGAGLGGEGNGGVIFRDINSTRDGLVATASVLALVSSAGRKLSALSSDIPEYTMTKTSLTVARERYEARAATLAGRFPGAEIDRRDGIRLEGPDWWLHIRPSNTEPIIRIIAEARGRSPAAEVEQARAVLAD